MNSEKRIKLLKNKIEKLENENNVLKARLEIEQEKTKRLEKLNTQLQEIKEQWEKSLADIKKQRNKYKKINRDLKDFRSIMIKGKFPK